MRNQFNASMRCDGIIAALSGLNLYHRFWYCYLGAPAETGTQAKKAGKPSTTPSYMRPTTTSAQRKHVDK